MAATTFKRNKLVKLVTKYHMLMIEARTEAEDYANRAAVEDEKESNVLYFRGMMESYSCKHKTYRVIVTDLMHEFGITYDEMGMVKVGDGE